MHRPMIQPVIHHLNADLTLEQASLAIAAGVDGVWLISHHGADEELPALGASIKRDHPSISVGLNYLRLGPLDAFGAAVDAGLDMVWGDDCGVSSHGVSDLGSSLMSLSSAHPSIEIYASVAFKYQPDELRPDIAAARAAECGFIPTTSGAATGDAPAVEKIKSMSAATDGRLAVASGMTPENVARYAGYLSHILVSTGVSLDSYRFSQRKLASFIGAAGLSR